MKIVGETGSRPDARPLSSSGGRGPRRPRGTAGPRRRLAAASLAIALGALALLAGSAISAQPNLPSPLEGPGRPELARRDGKRLAKAVAKLEAGDLAAARTAAAKAGDGPARRLLELQIAMATAPPPVPELEQLCAANPSYAAAWVTLAEAAAASGLESTALAAAHRSAELWPGSPWAQRAAELERHWVDNRIEEARAVADEGQTEAALELVEAALALAPADQPALLAKADLLVELGRNDEALEILRGMGENQEALIRRARLAEGRGDLGAAMALWGALPPGVAGREESLRRVQLEWRRQNLPGHVQAALAEPVLDRAGLAAVLIGLVPEAHAVGGGQVPVLSDIVGLDAQREILTAVRIGVMHADRLEHRFYPRRKVEPPEVRRALDTLCSLLGRTPPRWCEEAAPENPGCIALASPVSGSAVADVVLMTAPGEAQ